MASRGGTVLPSRGIDRGSRFVTRGSAGRQVGLAVAIVFTGAVLFAAAILVPKPDIVLTNPLYFPGDCDTLNQTRIVTAIFTLTNQGTASGAMDVSLYADYVTLSSHVAFEVPAHASIRGTLSGMVHDCGSHRYSLSATYTNNG